MNLYMKYGCKMDTILYIAGSIYVKIHNKQMQMCEKFEVSNKIFRNYINILKRNQIWWQNEEYM